MAVSVRELVLLGILGGVLFAAKLVLAALPNIELVTLLVMLYAVVFGKKALFPLYVYVGLEFAVFGVHLWSLNYLYVWLVPLGAAWLLRGMDAPLGWAVASAVFGLCFGALCAPVYYLSGGWAFALSWWISGIPWDVLHAVGNFVLALLLFSPLRKLLTQLTSRFLY